MVIASGAHLCSNPRVIKEADVLVSAGYEVFVLGGAYAADLKMRDIQLARGRSWKYAASYDLTKNAPARLWLKIQRRLGLLLWSEFRYPNAWQIFYGTNNLRRAVARLDADLTIAHWEAALPAAVGQLRKGRRVGIDMEDWFSEDLLPEARSARPIGMLAGFEKALLREGVHSTCTSEVMADALVSRYGCRRPVVIRNVFPRSERDAIDGKWMDRPNMREISNENIANAPRDADAPVSIHWVSQTIGPGRGLEELFTAARALKGGFEIHLRGESSQYSGWLDSLADYRLRHRVQIHPPVDNDELLSRIAEHDIGFAGERSEPPSRDLTITNKFFQYLQGGLAVVASCTAGQREGADHASGAVALFPAGDSDALRHVLQRLIDERVKLAAMRAAAWQAGARLCWENEAPRLLESVEFAISGR